MLEFMIVLGMPLGDLFLTDFSAKLAVRLHGGTAGKSLLFIPENSAQVMQEPCRRREQKWITERVHMVKKILRINVPLFSRQGRPAYCGFTVTGDIFADKKQLAESILCMLITLLRRCGQPIDSQFSTSLG